MLIGGAFTGTGAANVASFGQELIIHAVGSTNLTINPNLYTSSALTKSGTGTLTLGGTSYVTGNTYIEAGTVVLNAGQNTLFNTLTVAPTIGSTAITSQSGQYLAISPGATLDLNGSNLAIANLNGPTGLPYMAGTITNSSATAATFRFMSGGGSSTVNESFTGNLSIQRDGGSTITIISPSTFTGTATTTGGVMNLKDFGSFQNASAVNVNQGSLYWDDTGLAAVSNRLGASTGVNLNGGAFGYYPRQGTAGAVSVGALNVGLGAAMAFVYPNTGSSGALTFASVTRNTGGTIVFAAMNGTGLGAEARLYAASAPTLTNGIVGGWAVAYGVDPYTSAGSYYSFATYDAAAGFVVNNAGSSALFAAGANTRLYNNNNTYRIAGNTTTNSLDLGGSPQISFLGAGDILTIQSGGVLGNTGTYKMIGGSAVSGATVTRTDANTTGNNIVLSSVSGVAIGQAIMGAGIPAGSFITNVNPASYTVTLSQAVTATASGNYATAATGSAGTIVAGSGQSELFFHNFAGTLGINSVIADNSGIPLAVQSTAVLLSCSIRTPTRARPTSTPRWSVYVILTVRPSRVTSSSPAALMRVVITCLIRLRWLACSITSRSAQSWLRWTSPSGVRPSLTSTVTRSPSIT
jgi:autotransporter-associated beta strand protein